MTRVEQECTREYRKKRRLGMGKGEFADSVKKLEDEEEKYYAGKSTQDNLVSMYIQHNKRFGFWEVFPYPHLIKGRRLQSYPKSYIEFFEKYDIQGITKYERFFNFCKSVIYEYSPSLKEEVLRQESLVRLFAGLYYVTKYGKPISVAMVLLHLVMLISSHIFRINILNYGNLPLSYAIFIVSILAFILFGYLRNEILDRLRFMRAKELNLVYDGLFLICKKHKLKI